MIKFKIGNIAKLASTNDIVVIKEIFTYQSDLSKPPDYYLYLCFNFKTCKTIVIPTHEYANDALLFI